MNKQSFIAELRERERICSEEGKALAAEMHRLVAEVNVRVQEIAEKLKKSNEMRDAIKSLLRNEGIENDAITSPLPIGPVGPTGPVGPSRVSSASISVVGITPVPLLGLLMHELADGKPRSNAELAESMKVKGATFGDSSAMRVINATLLGASRAPGAVIRKVGGKWHSSQLRLE